jgi:hypothetical protein
MGPSRRTELYAASVLRTRRLLYAALLPILCGSASLHAQGPGDGAVLGVVDDSRRHPVAATILLKSLDSATPQQTIEVRADGTFFKAHIAPGSYTVSVEAPGYAAVPTVVEVPPGEPLELSITLRAAGRSTISDGTSPTTGPGPLPDENGDGLTSARGLEPIQNNASLDGASAMQAFGAVPAGTGSDPSPDPEGDADSADQTTGPANGMARGRHAGVAYVFSQSAVREFRATGTNYSAKNGRAGDVATMITRSGTEKLHGSAFFLLRSQAFAAADPLAIATSYANGAVTSAEVKPHDLRQSYGGTLGGPAPRFPRMFYFYNFDQQRRGFPAVSSPANPDFYGLSATQTALLANRGVTPTALNAALNYLSSLTGITPRRADQTLNFARIDWHPRHIALGLEYNAVRWQSPAGLIDAPVVARGRASLGNAAGSLDMVLLRAASDFGAHLSNEAHVSYLGDVQYEKPQTPLAQEPAIGPGRLAPEVNIGPSGLLFGTPAALSQQAYPDERREQLADTLTLTRGRHLIELGGEASLVHDLVATLANPAGTFRYDSGVTGGFAGGLVDFITDYTFSVNSPQSFGCPSVYAVKRLPCFRSFAQSFGETSTEFSTQEWAGFVQDTWRPRPRLTIRAGARYEYTLLPVPNAPNPALDAVFGHRGATSIFPEDRNNIGPRAAIAWEPFGAGKGVVHAGFGVFFGRLPGATIRSALTQTAQAATTTSIRIRPTTETSCPQAPALAFGYPCAFATPPVGVAATTTGAMVFDRRFRLPTVEQGSLSLERTVWRETTVAATYVFNLDRQLPGSTDINIAASTGTALFQLQGGTGAAGVRDGETFVLPVYTARVSPSFGPVTDIVSDVNATYHGVTVAVTSQAASSLRVRGDFTWSKAIDFGQAQSAIPRSNGQLDPFTAGYDKGLSSLNYPYALRVNASWRPKLHGASEQVRRAANGWDFAPILVAHSGRPYSLDLSGGTYLTGGHESINGSGGALYLPTVGRNTLRLPAAINADLRVSRGFQAGSRMRILASAEGFNLLNHRNVSSVEQRAFLVGTATGGVTPLVFQSAAEIAAEGLNTQAFGTQTATGTSLARERQVQFGVRVEF